MNQVKNVYVVFEKVYSEPEVYDLVFEIIFEYKIDALKWVQHQTHPYTYAIQEHPICRIITEEIPQ